MTKIRQMQRDIGVAESTYLAFISQEALSFLPKRRKGSDDFRLEHLLALKSFSLLRLLGVKARDAGFAVQACFDNMVAFASDAQLPTEDSYLVGIRLVSVRGKLVVVALGEAGPAEAVHTGSVSLDLRGVLGLLPEHLRKFDKVPPISVPTNDAAAAPNLTP